jgi:hypothetical protein
MYEGKTDVNMSRFSFWPVFWGQKLTSKLWIILFIHIVYIYSVSSPNYIEQNTSWKDDSCSAK